MSENLNENVIIMMCFHKRPLVLSYTLVIYYVKAVFQSIFHTFFKRVYAEFVHVQMYII